MLLWPAQEQESCHIGCPIQLISVVSDIDTVALILPFRLAELHFAMLSIINIVQTNSCGAHVLGRRLDAGVAKAAV